MGNVKRSLILTFLLAIGCSPIASTIEKPPEEVSSYNRIYKIAALAVAAVGTMFFVRWMDRRQEAFELKEKLFRRADEAFRPIVFRRIRPQRPHINPNPPRTVRIPRSIGVLYER